jgi:hypothetical protein
MVYLISGTVCGGSRTWSEHATNNEELRTSHFDGQQPKDSEEEQVQATDGS